MPSDNISNPESFQYWVKPKTHEKYLKIIGKNLMISHPSSLLPSFVASKIHIFKF